MKNVPTRLDLTDATVVLVTPERREIAEVTSYCFACALFQYHVNGRAPQQILTVDLIRILTVGLERACDGGSCGGNNLHLKRFPRISLSFMLVSCTTVRIRIGPIEVEMSCVVIFTFSGY